MCIKLMEKLFSVKVAGTREKRADKTNAATLLAAVENARRDWQQAWQEMNYVDSELSDYIIFKINSTERYYMMLLRQAKQEGITAWPATPASTGSTPLNTHP